MGKQLGIDLGTSKTMIYLKKQGIILCTPSVVAVERKSHSVVAVGEKASRMLGKTPGSILTLKPLCGGVISDYEATSLMLNRLFRDIGAYSLFNRPSVTVSVPYIANEVEKRALEDAVIDAGASSVSLIPQPAAAAIGAGLRINSPSGSMLVNIGAGTTETAIISMGGIACSRVLPIAGDDLDRAIVRYIKSNYRILIGEVTAEAIKRRIGSAHPSVSRGYLEVSGRNLVTGLTATVKVSSTEIRNAIMEPIAIILAAIKSTLENAPPELAADIYDFGILLTGGSAVLGGLDRMISENMGVRVIVSKNPFDNVCMGIGRAIENPEKYASFISGH